MSEEVPPNYRRMIRTPNGEYVEHQLCLLKVEGRDEKGRFLITKVLRDDKEEITLSENSSNNWFITAYIPLGSINYVPEENDPRKAI